MFQALQGFGLLERKVRSADIFTHDLLTYKTQSIDLALNLV
jgi:hypothetical protein